MWIESHQHLRLHPKTRRAARLLGISRPALIGHLQCLWWWALDHAEDGDLSRFDALDIAEAADWDGDETALVDALTNCGPGGSAGFLEGGGVVSDPTRGLKAEGLALHNWWTYAGKLIARRERDRVRSRGRRDNSSGVGENPATVARSPRDGRTESPGRPETVARSPSDGLMESVGTVPYLTKPRRIPLPPLETPEPTEPTPCGNLAQDLLDTYPHGWSDDGIKRFPTPLDVERELATLAMQGKLDPDAIKRGARALAAGTSGQAARFNRPLCKWLASHGWTARIEKAPPEPRKGLNQGDPFARARDTVKQIKASLSPGGAA